VQRSKQTAQLISALARLDVNQKIYKIEVLTCDMVNVLHLSLADVIDWLLRSHAHFISAHLHQGIKMEILTSQQKSWDLSSYRDEVRRLRNHPGFPCGDSLYCPVFLQDKFEYLRCLGSPTPSYCNPTFKFSRPDTDANFIEGTKQLRKYVIIYVKRVSFYISHSYYDNLLLFQIC